MVRLTPSAASNASSSKKMVRYPRVFATIVGNIVLTTNPDSCLPNTICMLMPSSDVCILLLQF